MVEFLCYKIYMVFLSYCKREMMAIAKAHHIIFDICNVLFTRDWLVTVTDFVNDKRTTSTSSDSPEVETG